MVLKNVFAAIACATLLGWSGVAVADAYRPDQFLGLDLSRAVLSPKPLGPSQRFAPVAIEARSDRASERASARAAHITHPKVRVAHTRPARHHANPLDAKAFDTRIEVWPCKSGGICNWKR